MRKKLCLFVALLLICSIFTMILAGCNKNSTITFDSMGGSAIEASVGECEEEPSPDLKGYELEGWYESKTYEGTKVSFPYAPKKNTTVYAKWVKQSVTARLPEVVDEISAAIAKSAGIDATKPFGASINLDVMGVGISLDAMIDSANLDGVKVRLGIANGGTEVINLFADDEFLYAVTDDAKKRFKDFQLADMLSGVAFPDETQYNEYLSMIDLAITLLFSGENATLVETDGEYTLQNSLSAVVNLLDQLNLNLPATVTDILASCDIRLNVKIVDGTIGNLALTIITPLGEVLVTSDKLIIGNDHNVEIAVPNKTDVAFDETFGLNFTLEGDVLFQTKGNDFANSDVVKFNYRINVDYNIFAMMRGALASGDIMKIDLSKMFQQPDSKIFIDITHKCDDKCGAFCNGKEGKSRGSIFTLAYSPQDFDSNNINLALNLKYLLPDGFIESLVDLGGMDIISIFGEYIGIALDPEVLLSGGLSTGSAASASANAADSSSSSMNIVGMIMDLVNFIGGVKLDQAGSELTLDIKSLLKVVETLTADMEGDLNIANILSKFFGNETTSMTIGVNKAIYGDTSIADMNIFEEYMIVDNALATYKDFTNGNNDYTPAKSMEWNRDKDGNVIIQNSNVSNYDAKGNALPLSEVEVKTLMQSAASYSYTLVNGVTKTTGTAAILEVIGLDYDKLGVAQEVTVITGMPDGGAISGLLALVKMIMPDFKITIPGGKFTTKVTITGVEDVSIVQPDTYDKTSNGVVTKVDMINKFESERVYYHGEKLNSGFNITVKYVGGETKTKLVVPNNASTYFSNHNNYNDCTLKFLGNFTMVFEAFGQTFEKDVKMADQLIAEEDTKLTINANEKYKLGKSYSTTFTDKDGITVKTAKPNGTQSNMVVTCDSPNMVVENAMKDGWLGPEFDGLNISFTKGGTYTVKLTTLAYYTKTYVITVVEKVVLPGAYSMTAKYSWKYEDGDVIELKFGRLDQFGSGLDAKINLTVANAAGESKLLEAKDYELCVLNGEGELVKLDKLFLNRIMITPYTVYVRILNKEYIGNRTATVDVLATAYADTSIVKATIA